MQLKKQINELAQSFNNCSEKQFENAQNHLLYDVLKTPYFAPDFPEVLLKYDESQDRVWVEKKAKFIPGKHSNNIAMGQVLDCSEQMSGNCESKVVLDEKEKALWQKLNDEPSVGMIKKIGYERVQALLSMPQENVVQDWMKLTEKALGDNEKQEMAFHYDTTVEELEKTLAGCFVGCYSKNIDNYANALSMEEVLKGYSDSYQQLSEKFLNDIEYASRLEHPPNANTINYEIWLLDTPEKHYEYNRWVSNNTPAQVQDSPWKHYTEKGLFFLGPVSQEDGIKSRYMLIAHNDLEVVGVTSLESVDGYDKDVYKMPNIGVQQKFRGKGVASNLFQKALDVVDKDEKFLLRTSPSEMGSLYTKDKFTQMSQNTERAVVVPDEENELFKNFSQQVSSFNIDFAQKKQLYNVLKEHFYKRLKTDSSFRYDDASELMSAPEVLKDFKSALEAPASKNTIKIK